MQTIELAFAPMVKVHRFICVASLAVGIQSLFATATHAYHFSGHDASIQAASISAIPQTISSYEPPDVGGPSTTGGSGTR